MGRYVSISGFCDLEKTETIRWQVAPLVQGETNSKGQVQMRTVRLQFFTDTRHVL